MEKNDVLIKGESKYTYKTDS